MPAITSLQNEQVKIARRVREGQDREWVFLEGERLVRDSLGSSLHPSLCFHVQEPSEAIAALLPALKARGAQVLPAAPAVMKVLGDTVSPQGIILLAKRPDLDVTTFWQKLPDAPLLVALDRVQDPGNLGTILRTAEAAGAHGVLTLAGSADVFSPKVLRASMGSALRLPMLPGLSRDLLLQELRMRGLRLVAASGGNGIAHRELNWNGPLVLVMGNEGSGIDPLLMEACAAKARIPIKSNVESLNVAIAAAVLLFEAAHQRSQMV